MLPTIALLSRLKGIIYVLRYHIHLLKKIQSNKYSVCRGLHTRYYRSIQYNMHGHFTTRVILPNTAETRSHMNNHRHLSVPLLSYLPDKDKNAVISKCSGYI